MQNILFAGRGRQAFGANFNSHKAGEQHPDRILDFHDIVYIREGGWEIGQDGVNHVLKQGDVIFLQAGCHHYGVEGHLPGCKTMYLHVSRAAGDALSAETGSRALPENALALPIVVECRGSAVIRSLFEDIIFTYWSEAGNKNIKLAALVDLLLWHLAELGGSGKRAYDELVEEALYEIRLTPDRIFTLSELADKLHVCSRSLTKKFKKVTGKTVHQYQLDLKLDMALLLIRDSPGKPFKEVAANLGLYDEFHFSKLFKRKFGVPPSEARSR